MEILVNKRAGHALAILQTRFLLWIFLANDLYAWMRLKFLPLSGDSAILLPRGDVGLSLSAGKYLFLLLLSACCYTLRIEI